MRTHRVGLAVTVAALATVTVPLNTAVAQPSPQPATEPAPAPRLSSGRPDLTGVWSRPYVPDMTVTGGVQRGTPMLPFTNAAQQNFASYDAADGDYTGSCFPYGLTRSVNGPFPMQIMQSDAYVTLLFELNSWFHVIPVDGRALPESPQPTWFGHSVGRWEDDTLVVETVGFNGYTRLDTIGHPHSDQLHLTQTFERIDADHLEYTVTVDDPLMYTEPWTNTRTFTVMDGELMEYSCEENNRALWEGRVKQWYPPWWDGAR